MKRIFQRDTVKSNDHKLQLCNSHIYEFWLILISENWNSCLWILWIVSRHYYYYYRMVRTRVVFKLLEEKLNLRDWIRDWIDLIDFHARVQECQPTWRIASIRNRFVSLFVTARSWQDTLYAREEVKATFTGQYGRGLPPSLNPFTAKILTNHWHVIGYNIRNINGYSNLENFHLWVESKFVSSLVSFLLLKFCFF